MPVEQIGLDDYVAREDHYERTGKVSPRDITNYDWGKRALRPDPPYLSNPDNSISTHRMAAEVDSAGNWWAFPTIVENPYGDRGKLMEINDHREALQWNQARGEAVPFGKDKAGALAFAEGGYKLGTPLGNRLPPPPLPEGRPFPYNVPPNDANPPPDYSSYRTYPYLPYERTLTQDSDRWTDPKTFDPVQMEQWKRMDYDPGWRLHKGYSNTWSYDPPEPESEQYRQGKNAMDDMTERVEKLVRPGTGTYDPGFIPMRGGHPGGPGSDSGLEQLHYDPSRSMDMNLSSYPGTGGQPRPAPPYPSPTPGQLPEPPLEDLVIRPNSMSNLRPAMLAKALGQELGGLTKEDIAKIGISLVMGGEGPEPIPGGGVPKMQPPGLKFHDPYPRYEGPGEPSMYDPGWAKEHSEQFPTPGSPEWFKAKSDAFQKKNFPGLPGEPEPGTPYAKSGYPHSQPVKVTFQDGSIHYDEIKGVDAQHALHEAWRNWPDAKNIEPVNKADEGPLTPKEAQDIQAYMDSLKNKPKMQPEEHFPNWDESHGVKEAKFDDAGHVDTLREYATRNNLSAEEYHKLLDASLAPKTPPEPGTKEYWKKIQDQYEGTMPPEDVAKLPEIPPPPSEPPEGVGPVDWDWYKPKGGKASPKQIEDFLKFLGKTPPYESLGIPSEQPPFEVPPGWDITGEDMGPRSSDFWDRFGWKPPPDPNSPDFPGPNRWDWTPPP